MGRCRCAIFLAHALVCCLLLHWSAHSYVLVFWVFFTLAPALPLPAHRLHVALMRRFFAPLRDTFGFDVDVFLSTNDCPGAGWDLALKRALSPWLRGLSLDDCDASPDKVGP